MSTPKPVDFALWCKQTQADMAAVLGIPPRHVTNAHAIGNLVWHRTPYGGSKTRAEVKAIFEGNQSPTPLPGPSPTLPAPDSWKNAKGSYLYTGTAEQNDITSKWLGASRYIRWSREQRRAYALTQTGSHIVIASYSGR
jgi:hypothetical protein